MANELEQYRALLVPFKEARQQARDARKALQDWKAKGESLSDAARSASVRELAAEQEVLSFLRKIGDT